MDCQQIEPIFGICLGSTNTEEYLLNVRVEGFRRRENTVGVRWEGVGGCVNNGIGPTLRPVSYQCCKKTSALPAFDLSGGHNLEGT